MEHVIDYTKVPFNYLHCMKRDCKQASNCLRQLAEQALPESVLTCNVIHPRHLTQSNDFCPHFRSAKKVPYAKGFYNMLGDITYRDAPNMIEKLKAHFGYRTYYRMRKGQRLLSPEEQLQFKTILINNGFTPINDFDAYEEDYAW